MPFSFIHNPRYKLWSALLDGGALEVLLQPLALACTVVARLIAATHAQVLLLRLTDRLSCAPLRGMVLAALTPLLRYPRGMTLFVQVPSFSADPPEGTAADSLPADASQPPLSESGYQRLLRAMTTRVRI